MTLDVTSDSVPDPADRLAAECAGRDAERAALGAMEHEISELCAHLDAATARLLALLAEFDRREGWAGAGVLSCAHWLSWRCGIGLNAAREKLRVAHALAALPLIREAFARGEVSYSKVRAMTRVATPENEDYLLMLARHGTASHVERAVRAYRGVVREAERERERAGHEARSVVWHWSDDGTLVVQAKLPPESGAVVVEALEALRERLEAETEAAHEAASEREAEAEARARDVTVETPVAGSRPEREPFSARRADALVAMAEGALASGDARASGADRHQVVVHVDAAVLRNPGAPGRCEVEHGPSLGAETARRLACDAGVVALAEDADGTPLDVGRKRRTVPPALRRALNARDAGCRFPGCAHTRFVDAHHVEHWAEGGETRLGNLVTLCRRHHRLVHEGGFGVRLLDDGAMRFTRPDGTPIPASGYQVSAVTPPSAEALREANRRAGLDLGPHTGECRWDGVAMDLSMAVDGLAQADGVT